MLPLGRYPYVGHVVLHGGRKYGTFGLSTSSWASEQSRLKIQRAIHELNRALAERRSDGEREVTDTRVSQRATTSGDAALLLADEAEAGGRQGPGPAVCRGWVARIRAVTGYAVGAFDLRVRPNNAWPGQSPAALGGFAHKALQVCQGRVRA